MNSEHLSHIVQQPDRITGQQALELEELCRKFPAFPTPFVLLARYYHQTGDYRAAEAIQKAAIRIHDRTWLADFVTTPKATSVPVDEITPDVILGESPTPAVSETENALDTNLNDQYDSDPIETELTETPTEESEALATTITADFSEENNSVAIELEVETSKEEDQESETLSVSTLFIPQEPDEWVFEEIEPLEAGDEATLLGFSTSEKLEFENLSDIVSDDQSIGAGGIIQPDIEDEENITPLSETTIVHETESLIVSATPYQIEQYYPSIQTASSGEPTDFYSWLSHPAAPTAEKEDEAPEAPETENPENHRIQQQSIIDRFIQSNPGVIRPKKEFFTPETAAKKSEHLPENLATETLARVYLQQGNAQGAIRIYERLMLKFPEKNAYFANLIQQIQKENNP